MFQNLLEPEACPALKVKSKSTNNVFSQRQYAEQNTQNSCSLLQNSGLQGLKTIFQHLLEPEVRPEDATLNLIQPKHLTHIEVGCLQILFSKLFQFTRRQLTTTPGIKRFSFMNMYRLGPSISALHSTITYDEKINNWITKNRPCSIFPSCVAVF